jgi:hypothetical protein
MPLMRRATLMNSPDECLPLIPVNIADSSAGNPRRISVGAIIALAACCCILLLALGITEAGSAVAELLGRPNK